MTLTAVQIKRWESLPGFAELEARPHQTVFLPFAEAREFAQSLGLKSSREWVTHCKSERPMDIPANPDQVYKHMGWAGYSDFLGTV